MDGQWEFQSGAFDNASALEPDESPDDMSVILQDSLAALGRAPEDLPAENPWQADPAVWGIAVLEVGFLKNEELQGVLRTPKDEELAHGDVRGAKGSKRRRRIKKHAQWLVRPAASP